jgi:hypothetical protein
MLIAQKNADDTFLIAHFQELFPDTSFSQSGPNAAWFTENNCYEFSVDVAYDADTQELVLCDPYLQDDIVYNRRAQDKPAP